MDDGCATRRARCPLPPAGVPTPGPAAPTPPGGPPSYDWHYAPPAPRRKLLASGVVLAILLATAAVVIGFVLLVRPPPAPAAAAPTTVTTGATPTGDTTDAGRALCTAIAPLMAENDQIQTPMRGWATPGHPNVTRRQQIHHRHPKTGYAAFNPFSTSTRSSSRTTSSAASSDTSTTSI